MKLPAPTAANSPSGWDQAALPKLLGKTERCVQVVRSTDVIVRAVPTATIPRPRRREAGELRARDRAAAHRPGRPVRRGQDRPGHPQRDETYVLPDQITDTSHSVTGGVGAVHATASVEVQIVPPGLTVTYREPDHAIAFVHPVGSDGASVSNVTPSVVAKTRPPITEPRLIPGDRAADVEQRGVPPPGLTSSGRRQRRPECDCDLHRTRRSDRDQLLARSEPQDCAHRRRHRRHRRIAPRPRRRGRPCRRRRPPYRRRRCRPAYRRHRSRPPPAR